MKKVRITVMKITVYRDLMDRYLGSADQPCPMEEGESYVCNGFSRPEGFCESAWTSVAPYVRTLSEGGGNFFDGWMKDPKTAMISCADGFRPVTFFLEAMEEDAEETGA